MVKSKVRIRFVNLKLEMMKCSVFFEQLQQMIILIIFKLSTAHVVFRKNLQNLKQQLCLKILTNFKKIIFFRKPPE